MSTVLSNENGIIISLNNNDYKISFTSKYNDNANIRNIMKQNKLYELLYNLNKDIIEKYEFNSSNGLDKVSYILNFGTTMNNFFDNKISSKYVLNLSNKTSIISNDKFQIVGTTSNSNSNSSYLNVKNLSICIDIVNNNIVFNLSYNFSDSKLQKNALVSVLSKIVLRLKNYLG